MPKKILFTPSYFYRFDEKQWRNQQPYPPYATILAASYIRNAGFEVQLFDSNLSSSPEEIKQQLKSFSPDYVVVYDDSFNYLSKMCLTIMRDACFDLIRYSKQAGCKVLVNSSDATDHSKLYLENGADIVMKGEGELTLHELLTTDCSFIEDCLGIAYLKNNEMMVTARRQVLTELDSLPQPAWDLINIDAYKQIWLQGHHKFSLNIATTRGCPFKCNWCAKPIYGNRYNSRSPQAVANELKLLMNDFGATHFWVCDDIFGLKPGWVEEFSLLLKKENLHPKLKIQCRADLLLKENTIQHLVAAGLDEVWMGAESGSQQILDAMDKGTKVEQIFEATRLLKKHGVKVCFFLQYGYLGESKNDIDKTLAMVKKLMPYDIGISVSYPLPGTGFHEKVKAQLQEKQNWTDSDDLAMMYQGTYSQQFYKHLHRHTHRVFRKQKSIYHFRSIFHKPTEMGLAQMKSIAKLPYHWISEMLSEQKLKSLQ
jgi:anaerobic magnesium-protoporphyrin IX monomethyl ester cyclase